MSNYRPISEQPTLPLNGAVFERYLQQHQLLPLDVALAAGVRYLTIWNITHDVPVQYRHAVLVRRALFHLTGEDYTGSIAVQQDQAQRASKIARPERRRP